MNKVLGLITARGGSKGLPGKNIKLLGGKPLIAYTIEAAKKSGVFDRVILSTDDEAIAAVARQHGCEVPFMRPAEFATDTASHMEVVLHALNWLKEHGGYVPDYVMILQPTSPMRKSEHIKDSVDLILKTGADSVVSAVEIPDHFHSFNAMIVNEDGLLRLTNGSPLYKRVARRQDRQKEYWTAGLIFLFKTACLYGGTPNFYGEKTAPYLIDSKYAIDIDTIDDFNEAEIRMKKIL